MGSLWPLGYFPSRIGVPAVVAKGGYLRAGRFVSVLRLGPREVLLQIPAVAIDRCLAHLKQPGDFGRGVDILVQ